MGLRELHRNSTKPLSFKKEGYLDSPSPINTPAPQKPSLSLKVKGTKLGIGAKKGKPPLPLKPGKKKPGGLKITRPPMKPPSA